MFRTRRVTMESNRIQPIEHTSNHSRFYHCSKVHLPQCHFRGFSRVQSCLKERTESVDLDLLNLMRDLELKALCFANAPHRLKKRKSLNELCMFNLYSRSGKLIGQVKVC